MTGSASVLGFIYDSPVTLFPVRTGPGTNFARAPFRIRKGTTGLEVLDVQPDSQNTHSNLGRVYQWFRLRFPDGQIGWMRGHVIGIEGDFSNFGYGHVALATHAYTLIRQAIIDVIPPITGGGDPDPIDPPIIDRPTGIAEAVIKVRSAANTRNGPSTVGFTRQFTIPRGTAVPILEVRRENRGQCLRWYKIAHNGRQAWIREDLVLYRGDTEALGLPWDVYPAPMHERWWVRDFNLAPNREPNLFEHWGWDFGAIEGEPILCGPSGGTVVQVFECPKCVPGAPNVQQHGLRVGDPSIFIDLGWGFGYGHYVVVQYKHDQLPLSTKTELTNRGFPNGVLYVMYAHLQRSMVQPGQTLEADQVIGFCGNSGNSEAPHLHLEVRASQSERYPGWAALRSGLISPVILYNR